MAKKPKWTRAEKRKTKRKSDFWWLSLDKQCKPGCGRYMAGCEVALSLTKPQLNRAGCGCALAFGNVTTMMSEAEYHSRFANAPKLVPGGPPVKVRLRMEVV